MGSLRVGCVVSVLKNKKQIQAPHPHTRGPSFRAAFPQVPKRGNNAKGGSTALCPTLV